ncbi:MULTISPECIES: hypothetical protein [pseudomallei group]|uniref:hypothetical protein n=1 Tax=pseudomallei group TaxID=111527 RepID=UPI00050F787B|nr:MULTISPECIES: hypothetical protein [pseudomallei group]KGD11120.1 hypothetical protein DO70_2125 [Burkholderia pseudomallei]KGD54537.1 hypothetical protein DP49_1408 [Burkholderia pseudomallei]KGS20809.1 hypothetical protein X962_5581 [Burkholderia pseudomallei MSHR7343]KGS74502.1 hypothetical protein X947_5576 [Burkholderia pseudomallei MSHR7334]MBF3382241.1 hypothetical protein [Burkholderia pseudomallei]
MNFEALSAKALGAFCIGGIVRVELFDGRQSSVWMLDGNTGSIKMNCANADVAELLVRVTDSLLHALSIAEHELLRWSGGDPDSSSVCAGLIADALSEIRLRERVSFSAQAALGDQEALL